MRPTKEQGGRKMPTAGKHERNYFEVTTEVVPPLLQAVAAFAGGVALAFANHYFVPTWSVVLTLILGFITLAAASAWSWRARHLLLDRKSGEPGSTSRFAPNSSM